MRGFTAVRRRGGLRAVSRDDWQGARRRERQHARVLVGGGSPGLGPSGHSRWQSATARVGERAPALRALDSTITITRSPFCPIPSYLILARATVQRPGKRLYDLLGFGAPSIVVAAPGATGAAGATAAPPWLAADASWLADLPPIPEAAKELGSLAALFAPTRSKPPLGAATKPAVLRELAEGAQVIAFATDGFASGASTASSIGRCYSPSRQATTTRPRRCSRRATWQAFGSTPTWPSCRPARRRPTAVPFWPRRSAAWRRAFFTRASRR